MEEIRRVTVLLFRAPFTRRAWLDVQFCTTGAITGVAGFAVVVAVLVLALVFSATVVGAVIGLPLALAAIGIARGFGVRRRRALRRATGERVTAPESPPPGSGTLARLGRRLRDSGGWRAVGYALVKLPIAVAEGYAAAATVIGLVDCGYPLAGLLLSYHEAGTRLRPLRAVVPVYPGHWVIYTWPGTLITALVGAVCVLAGVWLARGMTMIDARVIRDLLGPGRVGELERTRAIAVDDAAAALRRIERDLHDGAQARLAAVAMNLGIAQEKADVPLREFLDAAQAEVLGALSDLRRIARGIHPPALDSGLADALASLAAASPIPAQVRADLPERPPQAIETMAYFCVAELLANAIKHSSASSIDIGIDSERPGVLRVRVTDDGKGGADPTRGTGLSGLAQRASTVDGVVRVSSPHGGPTTVTIELPTRTRGGGT